MQLVLFVSTIFSRETNRYNTLLGVFDAVVYLCICRYSRQETPICLVLTIVWLIYLEKI